MLFISLTLAPRDSYTAQHVGVVETLVPSGGAAHVTKKEIVKQIADKVNETQLKTKEIVKMTFDAIIETLVTEGRIELRNFGVFEVKQRKPRKARNPRTGERVKVPARNMVRFKPGLEMEERIGKKKSPVGT